ncbi:MAG: hypothetical protein ACXVC0_15145 [Bdellovibrionota bacterium]
MKGPIILTERDKKLFRFLHSYGLARTSNLASEVFPGIAPTTALRRLRRLESQGYIARIPGLPFGEFAWRVSEKASRMISAVPPKRYFPKQAMEHDLKLLDLRLALEKAEISQGWISEHELRRKMAGRFTVENLENLNIPDGLMTARNNGRLVSVAVELELHFKNRDRYHRIFSRYQAKSRILAVWYLVSSPGLGKHLERLWMRSERKSHVYFLWSLEEEVIADPLKAGIFYDGKQLVLKNVFTPTLKADPALPPAQAMSSLVDRSPIVEMPITPQNPSEDPAPALR